MIHCRICDQIISAPFLSLGKSPLANNYRKINEDYKPEEFFPLAAYVCPRCFLVQLPAFQKAKKIFTKEYLYFSSYSQSWLSHIEKYVDVAIKRFLQNKKSFVIEIGSNDGYLLQYFLRKKYHILGIDPAKQAVTKARKKGIFTLSSFFSSGLAQSLREKGKVADLIICNNVIPHNDDLLDFVKGLRILLKDRGVITAEFPHVYQLIRKKLFDTIYHEHFSYFSLSSAKFLFELEELSIFDAEELPTHGGSLRLYIKHKSDSTKSITRNVKKIIEKEKKFGLRTLRKYSSFKNEVLKVKFNLLEFFLTAKKKHMKIVGYGAPAKAATLLNYCGIGKDFVDFTVDIIPQKQGKTIAGTGIPIFHPKEIVRYKPDYVIIFPWNIKEEIRKKLEYVKRWNGKLVIPLPKLKIY
ncbi:class I SAM-dependent methyltransferase [Candidatus Gottesmanbacteria bacterium]|nr:class I SAM-dependent methyltransferase [Candidatus Gottesmanbacteria bacterium]